MTAVTVGPAASPRPATATDDSAPATTTDLASRPVRDGIMTTLPFLVGFAPFALAIGASVAAHGDPLAGWSGSWLIFGGSAHLATLRTLETSGLVLAVLAGALVNARLLIYGASLSRRWDGQPVWFRLVAAPLIVDPTWAIVEGHRGGSWSPVGQRRFFLAVGLTLAVGWSSFMAVGAVVGDRIDAAHLAVAAPLCLAGLVGPRLAASDTRWVCVAAAAMTLVAGELPASTGVLAAIVAGSAVGAVGATRADRHGRRP